MRTRFLTPDYFTNIQTLEFLRLPLSPSLPPPNHHHSSSFDDLLRCCDDLSDTSFSLQLGTLPLDNALSKFYSEVLPDTINADYGDFQVSEKDTDVCYQNMAAQSCLAPGSETLESRFAGESNKDAVGDKNGNEAIIIQFETPELTQHLENVYMPEKVEFQLLPEVQECDDDLEMLNLVPTYSRGFNIIDQVSSVESICLDYDMTLKSQISDEADLLPNNVLPCGTFPLLEAEEVGPGVFLEDEWYTFFEAIEEQHSACNFDLELCCKNLLVSVEMDIMDSHASKLPLEFCFPSLNLAVDIDLLQVIETPYVENNTGSVDAYPTLFVNTFLFEEIMMLDSASLDIFEGQAICQETGKTDLRNMFHGYTSSESFNELIVSCELAIIDDTFTSMSVPDLVDDEKIWSSHAIIDKILTELEPLPLSTSDDIYLDWHLLGRDEYSGNVSAVIKKVFSDIEDYTISSSLPFDDDSMQVFDFLLSDDTSAVLNIRDSKVTMPSEVSCSVKLQNDKVASRELPDEKCQIIENSRDLTNDDFEKLASGKSSDDDCQIIEIDGICDGSFQKLVPFVESMPQFNDLDFFLNPKKATAGMRTGHKVNPLDAKSLLSRGTPKKAIASSGTIQMQLDDIQLHTLTLPANIKFLIDILRRSYLKILRDDVQLSNIGFPVTNSNDMNLLKLSEDKLRDHMSKSSQQKISTGHVDDNGLDFVALCAIKRMTWCLCFCGIYSLHHLICKLFQSHDSLKSRLSFLYSVIDDAYRVVDKEVTKSHPSLATIKDLLLQNNTRNGKVLILAQQVLWGPLKRLLTSMGLSFSEVDLSMHDNQPNPDYNFFVAGPREHTQTKCLLAPHECISTSILMQKFDIIVEYGGPSGFSKLSTHFREYTGSQTLHFLKVELDDAAKAMCEGVVFSLDNRDAGNLEALLTFGPIKQKCYQVSSEASGDTKSGNMAVPVGGVAQGSEQGHSLSFQDMPVIVNTKNFDKEMIISRRSTYQKVLNMEKRGIQVVERDLILSVDMILNTTTCLVWYDCNNIGKKATAEDEGASSVPLCIENIAANVLTSLSFVFTTCILIFEGDCNFLVPVMESADELYAVAASLDTYLQIFYSSSSELTDNIILNYIGHSKNAYKGSFSRLPDSETLAESFLSKFPSMNPLSAHAVVSSVCKLLDFFEMTVEGRVLILRDFHVADESVDLFSALCKYGEREESKSGVTDCSSSVSSPPDSGNFVCKINSADKKRKYIASSCDADFKGFRSSKKCVDDRLTEQGMLGPSVSKVCKSPGVCLQEKLPDFMLDDELFCDGDVPNTVILNNSNAWCEKNIAREPKALVMEDIFAQSTLQNDGFSSQHKSGEANNKYDERGRDILQDLDKGFVGEVADFYDKSLFGEDFQIDEKSPRHSPMISETAKYDPGYNRTARRLSFGNDSDQNIPLADEIDISCMLENNRQWRVDSDFNVKYNWSNSNFKAQERQEQPGRSMLEDSMQNFSDQFSKGKNVSQYVESPLSKAVNLGQLQQGSPWTIEFLNRIKEKRKLRQHCPPYASVPRTGYQGDVTKATKRRSPSILEFYKYQSGRTPRKVAGQKMQKQNDQLRSEKKPSEFHPICTPIDKRAKRSLSFATSGSGSQTKLVWSDNNSCSQDNRFPSRVMR